MSNLQYGRQIAVHLPNTGLPIIDQPRIDIDIQAQADEETNWAEVSLFNVSRATYAVIEERGEKISIDAGYKSLGGPARIFDGVIQRVNRERRENSFVCIIEASDALRAPQSVGGHINKTFNGDTSVREIAADIVKAMPDTELGRIDAIPTNASVKDFRAEGIPAEQLTRLLSNTPNDIRWYIDTEGVVRFDQGLAPRQDAPRIVKSPTTGLVSTPNIEEDGRLSAQMLLDPRVKLGSEFIIEDSEYVDSTPFKVVGIEHTGTNFRGQFRTIVDALPPNYKENE